MDLGNRMKLYEKVSSNYLPIRMPIIIRIDGRAFHTFTKKMDKPFDMTFIDMMNMVGYRLCQQIDGIILAYLQSDEINLLLYYDNEDSSFFNNKVEKLVSVTASLASSIATRQQLSYKINQKHLISFDSRAFILPYNEVVNYFIWRQLDWERNSLNMLARSYYTHKELEGKKKSELHELIYLADGNWANMVTSIKRGRCFIKEEFIKEVKNEYFEGKVTRMRWTIDDNIPKFTENRSYITDKLDKEINKEKGNEGSKL